MEVITANPPPPEWVRRWFGRYAENRRLMLYVSAVLGLGLCILVSAACLWARGGAFFGPTLPIYHIVLWLIFSLGAEFLWLETITGEATESMASTFNLAVLCLVPLPASIWIITLSVFLATRLIQKRDWVRSLFGLAQMAVTALVVGLVFLLFHQDGRITSVSSFSTWQTGVAIVAMASVYFMVNTCLVTAAVSLDRGLPFWSTWRTNYAYRNSVLSSVAMFSLSPLLLMSFLTVNYAGVLLFFLPLLIIKNQNLEHINLQKATEALISSERMVAKGEMAAEVAHEINNYLGVLSGHTQLLAMKASRIGENSLQEHCDTIRKQVQLLSTLAKGLLDFSHKEVRIERFDLNHHILQTLDFVKPQNVFDGVTLTPVLEPDLGEVEADPGQINQVLINLLKNAAEAMRDHEDGRTAPPAIEVRTRTAKGTVRIEVADNGPGMPKAIAEKVFEPGFTTKNYGHGFGLATCYRILQKHEGRIWVESETGQGATFVMQFPKKDKKGGKPSGGPETAGESERGAA